MDEKKRRVLFVCLGNICRSPLAEVVVREAARKRRLNHYYFESAGTGNWHVGGPADPRAAAKAREYGLDLSDHRARQITAGNIADWDWFVAMDRENRSNLLHMGAPESRILMMRQFETDGYMPNVPDPYFGGPDGFEDAYQMLAANAEKLLDYLESQQNRLLEQTF
jgi:protein-tyrosine phosphatase